MQGRTPGLCICAQTRTVAQTVATLPVAGHGVAQTVAAGELRLHPHPNARACMCMAVPSGMTRRCSLPKHTVWWWWTQRMYFVVVALRRSRLSRVATAVHEARV